MLPNEIPLVEEGGFISAEHYNQIVRTCNALLKGEGKNGVKVSFAEAGILWRGSGTGSVDGDTPSGGSAVAFRGHWNASTTYAEGDVVFTAGVSYQEQLSAHTYVSLQSGNINHTPPADTLSYEDTWWRIVSIGSWPTFVVANPQVADPNDRAATLAPGAGQFYYQGSADFGEEDPPEDRTENDTTTVIGGNLSVGKSITVSYGPITINLPNGTSIIIDLADVKDTDMAGETFRLREIEVCENGLIRYMGILATQIYDK